MITHGSSDRGWRKSTFSGSNGGACVEVRFDGEVVRLRDSKYSGDPRAQPHILVPLRHWPAFLGKVLGRERTTPDGIPAVIVHRDGSAAVRTRWGVALTYTAAEWTAFMAGVRAGEFAPAQAH